MRSTATGIADRFLLRAVSYRFGEEGDAAELRQLAGMMSDGDFHRLARNVSYHELAPLLHVIREDCSAQCRPLPLPAPLAREWRDAHLRETVRTAVIRYAAERALKALAEGGLRVVPLKGFFLDSLVYARRGARSYRDLDLLVEGKALADLHRILSRNGFRPRPGSPSFVPAPAHTVYFLLLEDGETMAEIDIHVGMHWPREYETRTRFSARDLWAHAFPTEVDGLPAWALRTEHLVVTTILDVAVNHRYARLVKFRDLLEIARRFRVDWDEVSRWSRRWEVASFVGPALLYLSEMAEDPAPLRETADTVTPSYASMKLFLRWLRASSLPGHRSRSFSPSNLLFFTLADSPTQRLRGLLHLPAHALRGLRRF